VGKPVRRNSKQSGGSLDGLAARLPDDLRSLGGWVDYRSMATSVADWLDTQAPGHGPDLSWPVMQLVGLTPAAYFRHRFNNQIGTTAPYVAPVVEETDELDPEIYWGEQERRLWQEQNNPATPIPFHSSVR
jgi:hypothetical protein